MSPRLFLVCLLILLARPAVQGAQPLLERTSVFPAGFEGVARYRIPGIVATPSGTLLAYIEARRNDSKDWGEIEVHLRRSTDQGRTWEPSLHIAHRGPRMEGNPRKSKGGESEQTVNNPVAIVDRETGAIEFLYCLNYARCFSMRSNDDGRTWSEPREITQSFEPFRKWYDWKVIATGPGHGIQMASGRLVVPIWLAYGGVGDHGPSAAGTIFSDDHGKTWKAGEIAVPDEPPFKSPNETMLATLSNGHVLLVTRSIGQQNRKIVTASPDGATQWTPAAFHESLWEPVCMASIVSHPSQPGLLVYSNPYTLPTGTKSNRGKRENLTIQLSPDDGKTWPVRRTIEPGPSAYSDLVVLPDGTIGCLFESGQDVDFARFNLEWISAKP